MIERKNSDVFVENKLPDGSRVLVDSKNERVIALNTTAGAAWDACAKPSSLSEIASEMGRSLGSEIGEDLATSAVLQLQENDLVKTSTFITETHSRRSFMAKLGAAAVPLVVAMTMTEQQAYAKMSKSEVSGTHDNQGWPWSNPRSQNGNGNPWGW
jgi:hypothetical protein